MIVQEHFDINGRDFIRTYSDSGRCVVRDGIEYGEACDPAEFERTYTEGELMSPEEQLDKTAEEQALTRFANSITGVNNSDLISATETLIEQKIKEG